MQKRRWIVLFSIIVAIIVIVPVSLHYYEIHKPKQSVIIDETGNNTTNFITIPGPDHSTYSFIYHCFNSFASTIFSSPHGGKSYMNMSLRASACNLWGGFVSGRIKLNASIQPGLHPSSLTLDISSKVLGNLTPFAINGFSSPILTNLSSYTTINELVRYVPNSTENSFFNFSLLNDSKSNLGRYYFSFYMLFTSEFPPNAAPLDLVGTPPSTHIYTEITFTLNGFNVTAPVGIGWEMVGSKN